MQTIILSGIKLTDLITEIRKAVREEINSQMVVRERLSKAEACRQLGVCYNTYVRMLTVTGREFIYSDEVNQIKNEYNEKKRN